MPRARGSTSWPCERSPRRGGRTHRPREHGEAMATASNHAHRSRTRNHSHGMATATSGGRRPLSTIAGSRRDGVGSSPV
jgi:hypothetical protein